MASSLHGNGSFSRLQYAEEQSSSLLPRHKLANNNSFLNPNHILRPKRIAIAANCANRNRISPRLTPYHIKSYPFFFSLSPTFNHTIFYKIILHIYRKLYFLFEPHILQKTLFKKLFFENIGAQNLSSKASLFHHFVDSDRLISNSDDRPNKMVPDEEAEVIAEELDQWVKDSAVEIVSNLDEAPFLVHVYGDNGEGSTRKTGIKLVREKAMAEDWPFIRKRWEGGSPTPNGVILVEDLKPKSEPDTEMIEITNRSRSSTKKWGILIQGKGMNRTAYYLLKTSQVQSVAGFCTHFCLVRVDCFVEHADILLKKIWLQS